MSSFRARVAFHATRLYHPGTPVCAPAPPPRRPPPPPPLATGLTLLVTAVCAQAPDPVPAPAPTPTVSGSPTPAATPPAPSTEGSPAAGAAAPATPEVAPAAGVPTAPAATAPAATAPGEGAARPIAPHGKMMAEMSAWSMFMDADLLVKAVMIGLAFASVLTWTIFLGKTLELMLAKSRLGKSMRALEGCGSLLEAQVMMAKQRDVTAVLVQQAVQETRLSADIANEAGLRERVASRFGEVQKTEGRIIRRGMGLLATMGSTAPFVGLFGTVWGIMNSFIGIAKSQTTNLAVVAPGIAEALLATAIGLVAAIPAVIVYNHFARATKGYMDSVGRSAGAVGRLLSRDLDRARGRPLTQAAE